VANRERKRAERRKRKARGGDRVQRAADRMQSGYTKAEERNRAAREALDPLQEGERPLVVTIGAAISALIATLTMAGWIAGLEVSGERPEFVQALAPAFLFGVMAWGMWKARYWAVLGFQTLLVFVLFASAWGLATQAGSALQVLITLVLLAVAGTLFYFMVKAMARIQMPHRLPPK
jgi:cation transport ATPase